MKNENETRKLSLAEVKKRVKIMTLISFIFAFAVIFLIIYRPMTQIILDSQVRIFTKESELDYLVIDGAINRGIEAAEGLSSRTMIRDAIESYYAGEITFEELSEYTSNKYEEGARTIDYLVSSSRYVDDMRLVCYTNKGYDEKLQCIEFDSSSVEHDKISISISRSDEHILVFINSPVKKEDKLLGYDSLVYDITDQVESVNSNEVSVKLIDQDEYNKLLASSEYIMDDDKVITVIENDVYYSVGEISDNIYLMTSQTQKSLYKPVLDRTLIIVICSILYILLFIITFYCYVLRFINKGLGNLEDTRDKYKDIAYVDFLTKAYTRSFLDVWNETIREDGKVYDLILFDVDAFKEINDNYGHKMGDLVLSEICRVIHENIREDDRLFRYGGDEFILILQNMPYEKLQEKIALFEVKLNALNLVKGNIVLSNGCVVLDSQEDLYDKINLADAAMYENKRKK